jgi:sulfur carrier protein ThiS
VRPGASVIVILSIEVMHYRVLSVNQFVDVGHEVTNDFGISFVDLLKQLDISNSLFVVCNDVVIVDTWTRGG